MPSAFISGVTITEPRMPVSTTSTAASAGMPPMVWVSAMAIGAVTDFAASEARIACGAPSAQAMADRRADRGERAGGERGQHRQEVAPHRDAVAPERQAERDGGGAEQEVHELRAVEIGLVAGAGGGQHDDQQAGGDHDRVRQRMAVEAGGDRRRRSRRRASVAVSQSSGVCERKTQMR